MIGVHFGRTPWPLNVAVLYLAKLSAVYSGCCDELERKQWLRRTLTLRHNQIPIAISQSTMGDCGVFPILFSLYLLVALIGVGTAIVIPAGLSKDELFVPVLLALGSSVLVFLIATVYRLQNIGFSKWWVLVLLVPIINSILMMCCWVLPEGYADTKKLDGVGKVGGAIILVLFFGSFIAGLLEGIQDNANMEKDKSDGRQEYARGCIDVCTENRDDIDQCVQFCDCVASVVFDDRKISEISELIDATNDENHPARAELDSLLSERCHANTVAKQQVLPPQGATHSFHFSPIRNSTLTLALSGDATVTVGRTAVTVTLREGSARLNPNVDTIKAQEIVGIRAELGRRTERGWTTGPKSGISLIGQTLYTVDDHIDLGGYQFDIAIDNRELLAGAWIVISATDGNGTWNAHGPRKMDLTATTPP